MHKSSASQLNSHLSYLFMSLSSIATVFLRWPLYSLDGSYLSTCLRDVHYKRWRHLGSAFMLPFHGLSSTHDIELRNPTKNASLFPLEELQLFLLLWNFPPDVPMIISLVPFRPLLQWHLLTRRSPIMPKPWNCNVPTSKPDRSELLSLWRLCKYLSL